MNSSVVDPTLHQPLRALRLSGMLETLDARLAQARGGELRHLDFLQVLCDDEITRREAHAIARRIRRARFDQQATLEEFDGSAWCFSWPRCSVNSAFNAASKTVLVSCLSSPSGPVSASPCA